MKKYTYKLVLIGDTDVGKTSIAHRFVNNSFNLQESTIGAAYMTRTLDINNNEIKLQIWDTAGQERFRTLITAYYRGASILFLVYDITNVISFESIDYWLNKFKHNNSDNNNDTIIYMIGNKADLKNKRCVTQHRAKLYAKKNNINFIETSAKEDFNITKLFKDASIQAVNKLGETKREKEKNEIDFGIKNKPSKKNKCKC